MVMVRLSYGKGSGLALLWPEFGCSMGGEWLLFGCGADGGCMCVRIVLRMEIFCAKPRNMAGNLQFFTQKLANLDFFQYLCSRIRIFYKICNFKMRVK